MLSQSSHGWKVVKGGTSVCESASRCGHGIAKGTKLSLSMMYATGNVQFQNQEIAQDGAWKLAARVVVPEWQITGTGENLAAEAAGLSRRNRDDRSYERPLRL